MRYDKKCFRVYEGDKLKHQTDLTPCSKRLARKKALNVFTKTNGSRRIFVSRDGKEKVDVTMWCIIK